MNCFPLTYLLSAHDLMMLQIFWDGPYYSTSTIIENKMIVWGGQMPKKTSLHKDTFYNNGAIYDIPVFFKD